MPNIRLILEYNGCNFHGWQVQPGLRTVQGELKKIIETVLREEVGELVAAGRTDAGVHARGQVMNFKCKSTPDLGRLANSVSSLLKNEVSVIGADFVGDEFNSRFHAKTKQYSYTILNRPVPETIDRGLVWFISGKLDLPRITEEAKLLIGEHDFASFEGAKSEASSTVRRILESELIIRPPYLTYRVVGAGFLKQMVRNIVGTLVDIGRGQLEVGSVLELLAYKDRSRAGVTAPAWGLSLDWVKY